MRDSASGPVTISPDFWSRPDVTRALARRDIGELFRLLKKWAGLSQTRIGEATGQSQGRVSYIINGKYQVTTINSLTRIADGLRMPSPARAALGLASRPASQTGPPPAPATPDSPHHPVPGAQYPVTTAGRDGQHQPVARRRSTLPGRPIRAAGPPRLERRRTRLAAQPARQHPARDRRPRTGSRPRRRHARTHVDSAIRPAGQPARWSPRPPDPHPLPRPRRSRAAHGPLHRRHRPGTVRRRRGSFPPDRVDVL